MDNESWFYFNNDWVKVKVLDKNNILINGKKIVIDSELLKPVNIDDISSYNNLMSIPHLNEPSLLEAINKRYNKNQIYTYTGKILISINPFKQLDLYNDKLMLEYSHQKSLPPHLYQITYNSYKNLTNFQKNQSILISGESGAGKTYGTKEIMKYIAQLSSKNTLIAKKVITANPILEAFGNACTLRNDNSSRFGKFIKMQFDKAFRLVGAEINTYLLEKSRVISQNIGEKNYHIFLNDGLTVELINSFKTMEFSQSQIDLIANIIQAIKNLKFEYNIDSIAELITCDTSLLKDALYHRNIKAGNDCYKLDLNDNEQTNARNSFIMSLYSRLFNYITKEINKRINNDCDYFIGILDIFGFESFDVNSFEQFCINYTNESLQEQFNDYIFRLEQIEYSNEGIDWTNIEFPNNKECLKIIEGRMGIIDLLNDECKISNGSDSNFTNKIIKNLSSDYLKRVKRFSDSKFVIKHYAGNVMYNTVNFCKKNKDIISPEIQECLNSIPVFNSMTSSKSRISAKTLIVQFRTQLKDLIKIIKSTNPHYIRCIKPNDQNISSNFDRKRANEQIKYSGILAAIKVSRAGYPVRFKYEDFSNFYQIIPECRELKLDNILEKGTYCKGLTKIFLKNSAYELLEYKKDGIIKKHVIFIQKNIRRYFKRGGYLSILKNAVKVQSVFRRYFKRKWWKSVLKNCIIIQKNIRKYLKRNKYILTIIEIIKVQKYIRKFLYKKYYQLILINIRVIQRNYRILTFVKNFCKRIQKKREKTLKFKDEQIHKLKLENNKIQEKLKHKLEEKNRIIREKLKHKLEEKNRIIREKIKRKLEEEDAIRKLKDEELKRMKGEQNKMIEKCQQMAEDTLAYKKDALRKIELYQQIARLQEENEMMRYKLNQPLSFKNLLKKLFKK